MIDLKKRSRKRRPLVALLPQNRKRVEVRKINQGLVQGLNLSLPNQGNPNPSQSPISPNQLKNQRVRINQNRVGARNQQVNQKMGK